ncbi:AbiJ-NTD4 domain-containing protein [Burkholderia pyrrocinia]
MKFSERNGFAQIHAAPITSRLEASEELRGVVVNTALDSGFKPDKLRELLCRMLQKRPDSNNWSPGNVESEVRGLLDDAQWYEVYDFIELLASLHSFHHEEFQQGINRYFFVNGIGWSIDSAGQVVYRGDEGFDRVVADAHATERSQGHMTASRELHEAIKDLSRRPVPDATGAVQHAMASLECVARDITQQHNLTLGDWVKANRSRIGPPLDKAIESMWGFTSNHGRHLSEGRECSSEEAELIVGFAAALGAYLSKVGKF